MIGNVSPYFRFIASIFSSSASVRTANTLIPARSNFSFRFCMPRSVARQGADQGRPKERITLLPRRFDNLNTLSGSVLRRKLGTLSPGIIGGPIRRDLGAGLGSRCSLNSLASAEDLRGTSLCRKIRPWVLIPRIADTFGASILTPKALDQLPLMSSVTINLTFARF